MPSAIKLKLHFTDRVGIVADVSSLLAQHHLSIMAMEVERTEDIADVYLEVENEQHGVSQEDVFEMLSNIADLREIRRIETLPHEEREHRFRVVLDNISEGVFSIDKQGYITTINTVARKLLNCQDVDVLGESLKQLNLPDESLVECLQGKTFDNRKQDLITEYGRFQFFASGRPIGDSSGHIVGAVEIITDMRDIKKLARDLSQPARISFSDFIGKHPTIQQIIAFAQKLAKTDSIVLLRGESGTGKELFAQAIHTESGRIGAFIPINCAALPESLLESELFGYMGGAFTGAKKEGKPGLFELASDGTIFLDEIGEMPLSLQAKMLRLIQERRVRRIGGAKEIPLRTRIITATNKNLEQMVKDKLFREDLYYRINVLPIHLPPLKERAEDIPLLVDHFLFQLASRLNKPLQLVTPEALHKLCQHAWPGNIRELRNVIERAAILCDGSAIGVEHILFSFEVGATRHDISHQTSGEIADRQSLHALLAQYERQLLLRALEASQSIRKTAKILGVSHTTLLNKLKKHQLTLPAK